MSIPWICIELKIAFAAGSHIGSAAFIHYVSGTDPLRERACSRKGPNCHHDIHELPAKVGKPVFATDNAQFFHPRIDAPPRLRSKEKTMKDTIRQLIQQALTQLVNEGVLPEGLTPAIQVENTRDKTHGDFASNIAMMLAKPRA